MPELSLPEWDDFLSGYPEAHILQTGAWGELKSAFGWDVARLRVESGRGSAIQAGAQVLFRRLPLGLTLAYIPKGPVSCENQAALEPTWQVLQPALDDLCRRHKSVFLKVEPDLWEPLASPERARNEQGDLPPPGFHSSGPPR